MNTTDFLKAKKCESEVNKTRKRYWEDVKKLTDRKFHHLLAGPIQLVKKNIFECPYVKLQFCCNYIQCPPLIWITDNIISRLLLSDITRSIIPEQYTKKRQLIGSFGYCYHFYVCPKWSYKAVDTVVHKLWLLLLLLKKLKCGPKENLVSSLKYCKSFTFHHILVPLEWI